jgi:hypothetical protein
MKNSTECCDAVSQVKRIENSRRSCKTTCMKKDKTFAHISTNKLDYNVNDEKQYKYCDAVSQTKELLNSHRPAKPLA